MKHKQDDDIERMNKLMLQSKAKCISKSDIIKIKKSLKKY